MLGGKTSSYVNNYYWAWFLSWSVMCGAVGAALIAKSMVVLVLAALVMAGLIINLATR